MFSISLIYSTVFFVFFSRQKKQFNISKIIANLCLVNLAKKELILIGYFLRHFELLHLKVHPNFLLLEPFYMIKNLFPQVQMPCPCKYPILYKYLV
jgi:hypothetical protein